MMDTKVILAADTLRKSGISVLITDAAKRPVGRWKKFETIIPTKEELEARCSKPDATSIATIGGKVSGGLEIIDFEGIKKVGKCCFEEWKETIKKRFPELFGRLCINSTPNGGFHVRYRYEAEKYDSQMDLARIPNTDPTKKQKTAVLIETRGEAHYALCPPSSGYEMIQGEIAKPPTISVMERNFLISIARSFNEIAVGVDGGGIKPGDDFNQRGDHRALLEKHGWTLALEREGGIEYWRRPGKEESWSATWNFYPGCFYVFSSNAEPFEAEKSYNLFAMFAYLEHAGDFKAAAKALREIGFSIDNRQSTIDNRKAGFRQPLSPVEESELLPAFKDVHGIKVFPSLPEIAWRGVFADFRDAHTNTTEASDEFLFASMLTATGAILGRRGWMWYARRLYPNFYSCIVGVTARSRKTTAAEKAIDLLQRCDPNVLYYSGLASAEGFINLFSALYEKEEAEIDARIEAREITFEQAPAKYRAQKIRLSEGVANYEGVRLLCYIPEFSGLLKKAGKESSAGLTEMLIAAYDNRDKLDNPTRTSPLSALNPSCSLITTTTIGRLLRALTNEETEGGFTNRFSYFIGDRKGPNDDPPEPDLEKLNRVVQKLVAARHRWANTQFQLHPQARQLWKRYYDEWFYQNENDVIDPITGRLPDQIRKLSLQYAMVENTVPEISPEQMEAAIGTGRYWHECICVLFKSYGLTETQQTEQQILEACANGGKSKTELYEYFQKHIDSYKLNQALENLRKVGRIIVQNKKRPGSRKSTPVFRLFENVSE